MTSRTATAELPIPHPPLTRSGVLRALLWKEWREQVPVLLSGLALLGVIPFVVAFSAQLAGRSESFRAAADLTARAAPVVLWPLIALAAGAIAFASDAGDRGRLGFLLSRPAHRRTIWSAKAFAAAVTLILTIVATELVAAILARATGADRFSYLRYGAELGPSGDDTLLFLGIPAAVCMTLACALFYSVWVPRPLTAVFAGGVTAVGLYAIVFGVWWNLDVLPRLTGARLMWGPSLFAAAALVASAWLFARGELFRGPRTLRRALTGGGAAVSIVTIVLLTAAVVDARPPGADAVFTELTAGLDGRLAATARRPDGASRTAWISDREARRFVTEAPRLTHGPLIAPRGDRIAYRSHGLWRDAQIRVRGLGADSNSVVAAARRSWNLNAPTLAFASASDALAIYGEGNRLLVVAPDGTPITRRELAWGCAVLGWAESQERLVTFCRAPGDPVATLQLIDPRSESDSDIATMTVAAWEPEAIGDDRSAIRSLAFVRRQPQDWFATPSRQPDAPRLELRTELADELRVIQIRGGVMRQEAVAGAPFGAEIHAATGGNTVAWVVRHPGEEFVARQLDVWVRTQAGEVRQLTTLHGFLSTLSVDPRGRWAVLQGGFGDEDADPTFGTLALSLADGRRVDLPADSSSVRAPVWLGPDRLATLAQPTTVDSRFRELFRYRTGGRSIRVHDLATGESWEVEPLR